jgi:hypothetical protein
MGKKYLLLICLIVLAGCKSKRNASASTLPAKPKIEKTNKIPADKIDLAQKDKAYELGRRVLMTCNTSKFKPFTPEEATATVIKNTTEERLTKTCHNFRLRYGEFKGVTFIEAIRDKKNKLNVYRFKAQYEKKIANKELRVIMNEDNLVAGIKSLDWADQFK